MRTGTEYLTMDQLAQELGVSRRWVQLQLRHSGLPHYRIGEAKRLIRFRLPEVVAWIESSQGDREAS